MSPITQVVDLSNPQAPVRRVLIGKTNEHITDGVMKRRAQQIAAILDCKAVQFDKGSEPKGNSWAFRFFEKDEPGTLPILILECKGTRGMVYTALGNYCAGLELDIV